MVVSDPLQLLLGMGIRMWRMRLMRLRNQWFFRTVICLIPPHQRCLGDMLPPANERNVLCLTVYFHRMQFCFQKVWTIAFVCGRIFHEVIESFLRDVLVVETILTELNHFFYPFSLFQSHINCNTTAVTAYLPLLLLTLSINCAKLLYILPLNV